MAPKKADKEYAVAVIGGGSWATALVKILTENNDYVGWWMRNKETVAEITRLSRKPCIKNAEDATACYDRIIPGLGNLACRSHGMHRCVALVQGKTLQDVHYHLKTNLGVSEENYKHCEIHPIYGTGQGSGNSPIIWLVISSVLFNCYESKAHGATFECPD